MLFAPLLALLLFISILFSVLLLLLWLLLHHSFGTFLRWFHFSTERSCVSVGVVINIGLGTSISAIIHCKKCNESRFSFRATYFKI